jgi:hypothetical protein
MYTDSFTLRNSNERNKSDVGRVLTDGINDILMSSSLENVK